MSDELQGSGVCAIEGKQGWLFLDRFGGAEVLGMYTREAALRPRVLTSWARTFEFRRRWFEKHKICLATIVAPEACVVYPDLLPDRVTLLAASPFERVRALMNPELAEQIIYPRQILFDGRAQMETYEKVDTHWSHWGAYLAYRALMNVIRQSLPNARLIEPHEISWGQRHVFGDLGVSMVPERSADIPIATVLNERYERLEILSDENRNSIITDEVANDALPTAIIFRDSFASAMGSFLSSSFRRTIYVSSRIVFYDLVQRLAPDVVICEMGERALFEEPDEPTANDARAQYDDLRLGNQSAIAAQRQSRSLLGVGKLQEALQASEAAFEAAAPQAPGHARALARRAQIFRHLGNAEAALECLRHAATLEADGAMHAMMAGELEQGQGQIERAIVHFRRAVALEPQMPKYWETLSQALILNNCAAEACDCLRQALAINDQRIGPHLLLIQTLWSLGDHAGAEYHARRAFELDGENLYALSNLASVLIRCGNWTAAHQVLEEALKLFPGNEEFGRYKALCESRISKDARSGDSISAML